MTVASSNERLKSEPAMHLSSCTTTNADRVSPELAPNQPRLAMQSQVPFSIRSITSAPVVMTERSSWR
jgi:hypothetical protein